MADYYRGFQLPAERAAQIRDSVLEELTAEREQATTNQRRARERLACLTAQRKAVLQAHYADALPLDLLKEEMDRLTQEMAQAERLARDAGKTVEQLEETLQRALSVASSCHRHYQGAPPHVRRQINQGFFTKLFIDQDGSVERAELTEPFATLLATPARRRREAPKAPQTRRTPPRRRGQRPRCPGATGATWASTGTDRRTCWSGCLEVIKKPAVIL